MYHNLIQLKTKFADNHRNDYSNFITDSLSMNPRFLVMKKVYFYNIHTVTRIN